MPTPNTGQPQWSQEAITALSRGFMESRVLLTGAELDLFTLIAAVPLTAEQIAERIGADRRALTILLDALAAMGLLVKRDGSYQTEASAARLLAADSPDSILPIIRHNIDLWERWGRLTGKVAATADTGQVDARLYRRDACHRKAARGAHRCAGRSGGGAAAARRGGRSGDLYAGVPGGGRPQMRATIFDSRR